MIRVLVVDDHALFRQGVVSLLASTDDMEAVGEAGSGAAALGLAVDLKPDIVILDVSMPDMDGLEAARRMKAAGVQAKIILLTMHKGAELLEMAADSGIQGYLLKTDAFTDLLYAVKAVLRGEKFTSASLRQNPVEPRAEIPHPSMLTTREVEIVALIASGLSSKEIATKLFISVKTVETHRANIMDKLGVKNLPELVRYAIRTGIVEP